MLMRQRDFRRSKSIVGRALAVLGMFILYENLAAEVAGLRHAMGNSGSEAPGILTAVILAGWRASQAYSADHQWFLQGLLQQLFISSWPLLLIRVGTVFSRDAFTASGDALPNKKCELVDLTAGRSTSK